MKVLIISSTPTHPTNAGNRARVLMMADAVQRLGHEPHIAFSDRAGLDVSEMSQYFGERFHHLRVGDALYMDDFLRRVSRRVGKLLKLDAAFFWKLDDFYSADLTPQLSMLHERIGFDAVIVEYVYMSKALDAFDESVLKILDTHDRFSNRHRLYTRQGQAYGWFSVTPEEELRGFRRADVVVAIQAEEAEVFARDIGSEPPKVVTVGHVAIAQQPLPLAHGPIGLIIASSNAANVTGVQNFINHVMPLVVEAEPTFQLRLVGDIGAKVTDAPGVLKLGRVPELMDAYRGSALSINPVQMGTGLCIKSLETMALGVPLVTTRSGARGLEEVAHEAMMIVEDQDYPAMAQAVLAVVRDPKRQAHLSDAGFKAALAWNEQQYDSLRDALALAPRQAALAAA